MEVPTYLFSIGIVLVASLSVLYASPGLHTFRVAAEKEEASFCRRLPLAFLVQGRRHVLWATWHDAGSEISPTPFLRKGTKATSSRYVPFVEVFP